MVRGAATSRFMQIKKSLIKNLRTVVEFFVTNESFDKLNRIRELQSAISDDDRTEIKKIQKRYRHQEVKDSLMCESFEKCMYGSISPKFNSLIEVLLTL